jgi:N-acetylneuraminic acid mutarotase
MKTLTTIFWMLIKKNITFYPNFSGIISLCLILFVTWMSGLVTTCFAQSPWTQKTDMPLARMALSSIALDGKIYAIGGTDSSRFKGVNGQWYGFKTVEMYDPILDSWEVKASMAIERVNFAACILNGKILAIGGSRGFYPANIESIEEYDPGSDTWTHRTNMPRARSGPAASLVNDKIYIIGGGDADYETIAENDVYDTLTHTWTTIADIPTPRIHLQAVVLNGKIYAIGGVTGASDGEISLTTVEEYDPGTDTWTTKADMITQRKMFAACALNGKIYVFGGVTGYCTGVISSVEEYNPATDTWKEMNNLPTVLGGPSVVHLNGKAYVIGGNVSNPGACFPIVVSTIYEYDPNRDLFPLIEKTEIDKSYAKPGIDSVLITTKMRDTTGITLMSRISPPDQTPVDSLQLFDDGAHNDGDAGDSLYANFWQVSSDEEQNYYVDLKVTRIDDDTVIHQINNMALFTTIGPVEFENYTFYGTDTIPNPGDEVKLKITLRNTGLTSAATNVTAKLISLNPLVSVLSPGRSFGDIAAGENFTYAGYFSIEISEEYPANTEVYIVIDITSDNYKFWSDTFSILVQEPTNIEDIKEPITRIYPNPTDNMLNIEVNNAGQQVLEIEIYTITGKLIYQKEYKSIHAQFVEQINLTDYAKGIYLMKVKQTNTIYFGKVVVR